VSPQRPPEAEASGLKPQPAPLSPSVQPGPPDPFRPARPEPPGGRDAFRPGARPPPGRRPQRRVGHLSSIANSASQALHGLGGLHTVFRSAANGDRPVAIHIPQRADKTRPVDLVLFFHGKGAQLDELFSHGPLADRLREQGRSHPNTVFAFPQGHVRERYHHWMSRERGESLARLIGEVRENAARLLGVEQLASGRLLLKAHSGGGVVFKNAIEAGELKAHRIEFLDAMYGNWGDLVAQWAKRPENAGVEFAVVYSPHQQAQVRSFRKALDGQRTMHIERARVGHSQIPYEYWQIRPMGGR
jgi:hypothetical protein